MCWLTENNISCNLDKSTIRHQTTRRKQPWLGRPEGMSFFCIFISTTCKKYKFIAITITMLSKEQKPLFPPKPTSSAFYHTDFFLSHFGFFVFSTGSTFHPFLLVPKMSVFSSLQNKQCFFCCLLLRALFFFHCQQGFHKLLWFFQSIKINPALSSCGCCLDRIGG